MSRLIVKNLPSSVTEKELRDNFSLKGEVTDVQLKYNSKGEFRNFAFVGFKSQFDAEEALGYFNRNYFSNKKITVEICRSIGEKQEKAAKVSEIKDKLNEQTVTKRSEIHEKLLNILKKYENDPTFKEFMVLHKMDEKHLRKVLKKFRKYNAKKAIDENVSDLEYMKSIMKFSSNEGEEVGANTKLFVDKHLFTVKIRGLPRTCSKKELKDFFRPNLPYSYRIPRGSDKGFAYVTFKTAEKMSEALAKNKSFMRGHQIYLYEFTSNRTEREEKSVNRNTKWEEQTNSLKNENVAESGKIFIRNLSYTVNEQDIRGLFEKYGPVTEINLPVDKITRKIKGFGTVTFMMPEHAVQAFSELDRSTFQGRSLHLLPAKSDSVPNDDDASKPLPLNFKKMKESQSKLKANLPFNWNSLFMGHDTVANALADTMSTTKESILDPFTKTSAAVRLALGESSLVSRTKEYLENNGVCLDIFGQPINSRSTNVIIVKNLPYGTEEAEINDLFNPFGVLERVVMPPKAVTALVEFQKPSEAKKAYQTLAYSRFKSAQLLLEWAPEKVFLNSPQSGAKEIKVSERDGDGDKKSGVEGNADGCEPEPDSTLYITNLNLDSREEDVKKHFSKCGDIHSVIVAYKKSSKSDEDRISMGYGFVQFQQKSSAEKALKTLQKSVLMDRCIELKRSEKTLKLESKNARKSTTVTKQTGTKILIKNVPFETNKKELRDLFQVFGLLKSVRIPQKTTDGESHRGFAFVDYQSKTDALNAFKSLSASTHLYGRRLVLEWAKVDEDVIDTRKRTAKNFHSSDEPTWKRRKTVFSSLCDRNENVDDFEE